MQTTIEFGSSGDGDGERRLVVGHCFIHSIEDVNRFLMLLQDAARGLWPDIAFRGDPDFPPDEDEPTQSPPEKKKPHEGTISRAVLNAVETFKTLDVPKIMKETKLNEDRVMQALGTLRAGGFLKDLP